MPPIKHSSSTEVKKTGTVISYELPGGGGLRGLLNDLADAKRNQVIRNRKLTPAKRRNLEKAQSAV